MYTRFTDLAQGVAAQGRVEAHEEPRGEEAHGDADGDGRAEEEEGAETCFWVVGVGVGGVSD